MPGTPSADAEEEEANVPSAISSAISSAEIVASIVDTPIVGTVTIPPVLNLSSGPYGVEVSTWGTHTDAGNGMVHYLGTDFFGGNVGHASITMKVPATPEYKALLEKYCDGDDIERPEIPYRLVTNEVKLAQRNEDDSFSASKTNAYTESYYEVYWSWWPGADMDEKESFSLVDSVTIDRVSERDGVHFPVSAEIAEHFNLEHRVQRGTMGGRVVTLAPQAIIHQRNLSDEEMYKFQVESSKGLLNAQQASLDVLFAKLDGHGYLSTTEKKKCIEVKELLNSLGIPPYDLTKKNDEGVTFIDIIKDKLVAIFPDWEDNVKNIDLVTKEEIDLLLKGIDPSPNLRKAKVGETEKILLNRFVNSSDFNWRDYVKNPDQITEEECFLLKSKATNVRRKINDKLTRKTQVLDEIEQAQIEKKQKMRELASKYLNLQEQINSLTLLQENILTEEDIELLDGQISDLLGSKWPDKPMVEIKSKIGEKIESLDMQVKGLEEQVSAYDYKKTQIDYFQARQKTKSNIIVKIQKAKGVSIDTDDEEKEEKVIQIPIELAGSWQLESIVQKSMYLEEEMTSLYERSESLSSLQKIIEKHNAYSITEKNKFHRALDILSKFADKEPPVTMKYYQDDGREFCDILDEFNKSWVNEVISADRKEITPEKFDILKGKLLHVIEAEPSDDDLKISPAEKSYLDRLFPSDAGGWREGLSDHINLTPEDIGILRSKVNVGVKENDENIISNMESKKQLKRQIYKMKNKVVDSARQVIHKESVLCEELNKIKGVVSSLNTDGDISLSKSQIKIIQPILPQTTSSRLAPGKKIIGRELDIIKEKIGERIDAIKDKLEHIQDDITPHVYHKVKYADASDTKKLDKAIFMLEDILNASSGKLEKKIKGRGDRRVEYKILPLKTLQPKGDNKKRGRGSTQMVERRNPDYTALSDTLRHILPDWNEYVNTNRRGDIQEITAEQLGKILAKVDSKRAAITADLDALKRNYNSALSELEESIDRDIVTLKVQEHDLNAELRAMDKPKEVVDSEYISAGILPSNVVALPFATEDKEGMDIESMLREMRVLVSDGEFNLAVNNCSVTTGSILEAGAPERLKIFMRQRALGAISNPQIVHSGARELQSHIVNKDSVSFVERMSNSKNNPFKVFDGYVGKQLHNLMDKKQDPETRRKSAGILVALALPIALGVIVRAIINPDYNIKRAASWIKFVNSKEGKGPRWRALQVLSYIAVGIVTTIAALPWVIQKTIINPLVYFFNVKRKPSVSKDLDRPDKQSEDVDRVESDNNNTLKSRMKVIKGMFPDKAILEMQNLYDSSYDVVPCFSAIQQKVVDKYLEKQSSDERKEVEQLFNNIVRRANLLSQGKLEKPKEIINPKGKSSSAPAVESKSKRTTTFSNSVGSDQNEMILTDENHTNSAPAAVDQSRIRVRSGSAPAAKRPQITRSTGSGSAPAVVDLTDIPEITSTLDVPRTVTTELAEDRDITGSIINEFPKRNDCDIADKIDSAVAIIVEKYPDKEFNFKCLKGTNFDIKSPDHVEFITNVCEKLKDHDYTIKAGRPFAKALKEQLENNEEKEVYEKLKSILVLPAPKHSGRYPGR